MLENLCNIYKFVCWQTCGHVKPIFHFSKVLKLSCPCTAATKWHTATVKFLYSKIELNCLFGFSWKKVSQRDSSMAALDSSWRLLRRTKGKIFQHFKFLVFVFFQCRLKMEYSCFQDSSVIRNWVVYLVFGLREALPRRNTPGSNESESWTFSLTRFQELHPRWAWVIVTVFVSF